MRILNVVDGDYPWDVRVEKVSLALTTHGHDVHMVARNRDRRPLREELKECTMHRMRPWPLFGKRLDGILQFPAFFSPRWSQLITRVGREERAQVILVRDIPLAPTAVWVGRRLGIPVILDMAENYPAMIRDLWTTSSTHFGDFFVRNPRAVEAVERWTVARVDHILVVVEESRDRLMEELGVPASRLTVVGNTPSAKRLERFPGPSASAGAGLEGVNAPLDLVYLGLLEQARGVAAAIEAVALCRDRGVPIRFTVIGDGRARTEFESLIRELSLTDSEVVMKGFLPYEEALEIVSSSQVGIIPHLPNESWNTTIPNKLFDYMAAGLAVISSDAKPAKRVVEETGCGRWFVGGDAESLTNVLEDLWRSGRWAEHGLKGREAIRNRFNWEQDVERLLEAFRNTVAATDLSSASASGK